MTRYLVTDTEIQCAIHEAIKTQDQDPKGNDYIIASTMDVASHVIRLLDRFKVDDLRLLDRFKVADSEQTENSKQDVGREIDTSEYPFIRLEANQLVGMICDAYLNGLSDK